MNDELININKQTGVLQRIVNASGFGKKDDQFLEMIGDAHEKRGNRLCVSISDIHLTDGTVGFQNLSKYTWDAFYDTLKQRCITYQIDELVLVLDGDIVDMIRSSKWAENNIYPWQREKTAEFSAVVNAIIKDIVKKEHSYFFDWLQNLETKLKEDKETKVKQVKIVVLLGNHDKELFCDQKALKYFYEKGLGRKVVEIPKLERKALGRMYGDEQMFTNTKQAPYLPFYFGDRGFRFFTTHGQWRDKENSHSVKAEDGKPGWSAADGWNIETWQQLKFSPFLQPCFGDTVAAGVLSTFIYKVKKKLKEEKYKDQRLNCILDELDLYRPTYAALNRILHETSNMRSEKRKHKAIEIIEKTLYKCIIDWLSWPYTYQSSPFFRRIGLKLAKRILEIMKSLG
ncbi:MAG: metallophosphoesterase, partial [Methylococcales bacterium]|nr:metallophosphoesterase [Methylococcales bacterium]